MPDFVLGIAVLLGLIIVFYTLPRMCIEGALTWSEAVLVSLLLLLALFLLGQFRASLGGAVLAILYFGVIAFLPYARIKLRGRTRQAFLQREIARWERTIAFDPQNSGAYVFLAQAYAELGDLDNALKYYEAAFRLRPADIRARRDYDRLLQEKRSRTGAGWTCLVCRCENAAEATRCLRCDAPAPRSLQEETLWLDRYVPHVAVSVAVVLVILRALNWISQGLLLVLAVLLFALVYVLFALRQPE